MAAAGGRDSESPRVRGADSSREGDRSTARQRHTTGAAQRDRRKIQSGVRTGERDRRSRGVGRYARGVTRVDARSAIHTRTPALGAPISPIRPECSGVTALPQPLSRVHLRLSLQRARGERQRVESHRRNRAHRDTQRAGRQPRPAGVEGACERQIQQHQRTGRKRCISTASDGRRTARSRHQLQSLGEGIVTGAVAERQRAAERACWRASQTHMTEINIAQVCVSGVQGERTHLVDRSTHNHALRGTRQSDICKARVLLAQRGVVDPRHAGHAARGGRAARVANGEAGGRSCARGETRHAAGGLQCATGCYDRGIQVIGESIGRRSI